MDSTVDVGFMRAAIALTASASERGDNPAAALLVLDGAVVVEASSRVASSGDATAHAVMELVRGLCSPGASGHATVPADARSRCTVYTSCEPCVMCVGALNRSGVGRVVFGCRAAPVQCVTLSVMARLLPRAYGQVLEAEALTVLRGHRGAVTPAATAAAVAGKDRGNAAAVTITPRPKKHDHVNVDTVVVLSFAEIMARKRARADPGGGGPQVESQSKEPRVCA